MVSAQTSNSAMADFVRLYRTNMLFNTQATNSISFQKFMDGCHVIAYDLTTSNTGGALQYHTPSVRVGNVRVKITFNKVLPPELPLELLVWCEFNNTLSLDHKGVITDARVLK